MNDYTDDEELEFVESLYNKAEMQIKEVYQEQKKNRDELLQQIATIMITYTILNDLMKLSSTDKKKEYNRLSKMVTSGAQSQGFIQNRVIKDILTTTVNKAFDFYSYNVGLKDVKEIIGNNFKGKHFSSRVWDNESDVAKHLHKQVNDFLNGKVNVNQIKRNIEKNYNASAYNAHRLVETEVARVENESFKRFCKETDVKKVRRIAVLDNRTCNDCAGYDNEVYELVNAPDLPAHPLCRCYLTIENDEYEEKSKNKENNGIIKTDSKGNSYLSHETMKSDVRWNDFTDISESNSKKLNEIHTDLNKFMNINNREKLVLLDINDNKIIHELEGNKEDEVNLTKKTIELFKRSKENSIIFIHNHPSKTTFSRYDIQHIIRHKSIKTMTLECVDGRKYILDNGELKSSVIKDLLFPEKYNKIYNKVAENYPQLENEVEIYYIWDDFLDAVNKEVAKEYGMEYRKVE